MAQTTPILPYGRDPRPGSITFTDQPDGSVDTHIRPRPLWQLLLAGAVLVSPIAAMLTHGFRTGRIHAGGVALPPWLAFLIIGASLFGPAVILAFLIRNLGGQHVTIHAGRDGLRILYTDHGDPCRHEWPADQVTDVRFIRSQGGGYNLPGLAIHLKGRVPFPIPIYRRKKHLTEIARRCRQALGLPDPPVSRTGAQGSSDPSVPPSPAVRQERVG